MTDVTLCTTPSWPCISPRVQSILTYWWTLPPQGTYHNEAVQQRLDLHAATFDGAALMAESDDDVAALAWAADVHRQLALYQLLGPEIYREVQA